ncbi:class I SAM-dependent methyltransferase [Candidatus Omnitrophota bacterium]
MSLLFPGKKLSELHKIEGHLGRKECGLLYKIAKSLKKNSVVVEIGAFLGKSTCFIAEGIGNKQVQFFAIDTWFNDKMQCGRKDVFSEFLEHTKDYQDKIKLLRGYSYAVVKDWPQEREIDFLFIDGDHDYEGVKRDIQDWLPLVKDKGIVCFHDYRDFPGVIQAVDEVRQQGRLKFIRQVTSVYMAQYIRVNK